MAKNKETTRTIETHVSFYIQFKDSGKEIKSRCIIPLNLQDTDVYVLPLNEWAESFLNSMLITDYITSLCESKIEAMTGDIQLGKKGYSVKVLSMYED